MAGERLGDNVSSVGLSCALMRVLHCRIDGRGGKSTKILYSSKSTITLLKFLLKYK